MHMGMHLALDFFVTRAEAHTIAHMHMHSTCILADAYICIWCYTFGMQFNGGRPAVYALL